MPKSQRFILNKLVLGLNLPQCRPPCSSMAISEAIRQAVQLGQLYQSRFTVDHVIPRSLGGSDDLQKLVDRANWGRGFGSESSP